MTKTRTAHTVAVAASAALLGMPALAADHLDSPSVTADGSTDINDLYAFQSPTNADNAVLVLTVNPGAGAISGNTFNPTANYQFQVDNTGDALSNVTFNTTFGPVVGGVQTYTVTRNGAAYATGSTGVTTSAGGVMSTAGLFDDPFFFDLAGFNDGFNFTGDDFFAGLDVSAIILEVPRSDLGGDNIGVWGRTADAGDVQIDRVGRPAISTALIGSDARKDDYNAGVPSDDPAEFGAEVQAAIESLNGGDTATAAALTSILLPDILTIDTSNAAGFLNGRQLADDVIDAELALLTNGAVTGDGVNANDQAFLGSFPYLAPANVPEPASAALLAAGSLLMIRRRVTR